MSDDLISRQAAIDDAKAHDDGTPWSITDVMAMLNHVPSAEPERKKGKWIHKPELGWGETWVCSECGEKTTSTIMGYPRYKWCPMCGIDMRGEKG